MVREEEGRMVVLAGVEGWWCDGGGDSMVAGKKTKRRRGQVGDSNAIWYFFSLENVGRVNLIRRSLPP